MVLVDTSAWLLHLRKNEPIDLTRHVDLEDIVTCLPVIQEVLQGIRDERAFRIARESFAALPRVESPLGAGVFDDAVDLYRTARRAGLTIRSSVDCLIAACALRHGLTVLHHDRDYEAIRRVAPLNVRGLR